MASPRGADRRIVMVGLPPTPNGDLHVGHIAGPYLAEDVYVRYLRATGRDVLFTSGTDDSQTYVVATAARLGTTPAALAEKCWHEIRAAYEMTGIALDGFAPFDDGYRSSVLDFFGRLYDAGKLRLRTVRLPYSERTGQFLVEGLVCGDCPVCLIESRGGLCETCGHPNNFDELIHPRSTVDPTDPVVTREVQIMVLPLEEYRVELTAYHEDRQSSWRPHMRQLIRELLARPLPDFPVTYPISWGIPAPFKEAPGQVFNAWAEGMPGIMYCTAFAQRELGEQPASSDELWRAGNDIRLGYCLGFDNVYFWAITHVALLLAHDGRYVLPDFMVCNEFYELEHEKFSTSLGHLLLARDLLAEVPRDLVRFYLALTSPEHSRTHFSRAVLNKVVGSRLVEPWNRMAGHLAKAVAELGAQRQPLPVSAAARRAAAAVAERFSHCYELDSCSLSRAAELIVMYTDRLQRKAAQLVDRPATVDPEVDTVDPEMDRRRLGDLFCELRALIAAASPIMIDLSWAAASAGGFDGAFADTDQQEVWPFAVPLLDDPTGKRAQCASS